MSHKISIFLCGSRKMDYIFLVSNKVLYYSFSTHNSLLLTVPNPITLFLQVSMVKGIHVDSRD
jgi:hypothetical protein